MKEVREAEKEGEKEVKRKRKPRKMRQMFFSFFLYLLKSIFSVLSSESYALDHSLSLSPSLTNIQIQMHTVVYCLTHTFVE